MGGLRPAAGTARAGAPATNSQGAAPGRRRIARRLSPRRSRV